jgi:hypothetical protein
VIRPADGDTKHTKTDEEREAERAAKHQEEYAKDLQEIWDKGIEHIVESTQHGFRAMLESVQSLFQRHA